MHNKAGRNAAFAQCARITMQVSPNEHLSLAVSILVIMCCTFLRKCLVGSMLGLNLRAARCLVQHDSLGAVGMSCMSADTCMVEFLTVAAGCVAACRAYVSLWLALCQSGVKPRRIGSPSARLMRLCRMHVAVNSLPDDVGFY